MPRLSNACGLPQLATWPATCRDQGLQAWLQIDRDAASRLGVITAAIDNALYNAFGQRLVSTIFTQASQYRVVLEVASPVPAAPEAIAKLYVPGTGGKQVPCRRRAVRSAGDAGGQPRRAVPGGDRSRSTWRRAWRWATPSGDPRRRGRTRPAGEHRDPLQGAALAFQPRSTSTLLLILAAMVTMYIVLGVLYELHPPHHHPVHAASAGVGALLALLVARTTWASWGHRHHAPDRHRQRTPS